MQVPRFSPRISLIEMAPRPAPRSGRPGDRLGPPDSGASRKIGPLGEDSSRGPRPVRRERECGNSHQYRDIVGLGTNASIAGGGRHVLPAATAERPRFPAVAVSGGARRRARFSHSRTFRAERAFVERRALVGRAGPCRVFAVRETMAR